MTLMEQDMINIEMSMGAVQLLTQMFQQLVQVIEYMQWSFSKGSPGEFVGLSTLYITFARPIISPPPPCPPHGSDPALLCTSSAAGMVTVLWQLLGGNNFRISWSSIIIFSTNDVFHQQASRFFNADVVLKQKQAHRKIKWSTDITKPNTF